MRIGDIVKTADVEGKEKHVPWIEVGKGKGEAGADIVHVVVGKEVLDARPHALFLQPRDVGDRHPGSQERVFGIALEVPARERRPVDIDRRGEQHVGAFGFRFQAERAADLIDQIRVPRRA